jgi:excisionase family DNA binding protein
MRSVLDSQTLQPDAPLLLRVPEVARILSLSRSRTYEMIHTGELPFVRMGKSVRVPRKALLALIERQTVNESA